MMSEQLECGMIWHGRCGSGNTHSCNRPMGHDGPCRCEHCDAEAQLHE